MENEEENSQPQREPPNIIMLYLMFTAISCIFYAIILRYYVQLYLAES